MVCFLEPQRPLGPANINVDPLIRLRMSSQAQINPRAPSSFQILPDPSVDLSYSPIVFPSHLEPV